MGDTFCKWAIRVSEFPENKTPNRFMYYWTPWQSIQVLLIWQGIFLLLGMLILPASVNVERGFHLLLGLVCVVAANHSISRKISLEFPPRKFPMKKVCLQRAVIVLLATELLAALAVFCIIVTLYDPRMRLILEENNRYMISLGLAGFSIWGVLFSLAHSKCYI